MANNIRVPQSVNGADPLVSTQEKTATIHTQNVQLDGGNATNVVPITAGEKQKSQSLPMVPASDAAYPGAPLWATGQITLNTGAQQIVPARATRRSITIQNHGAVAVWLGPPTVSSATGFRLPGVDGSAITFNHRGVIQGIVSSGSQLVSWEEEYD